MNKQYINILMVEDHPLILDRYIEVVKNFESQGNIYHFEIERVHSIVQAEMALKSIFNKRKLHMVFLDIGLPGNGRESYKTGLNLGMAIRESHPETLILVITGYSDHFLLQNIFNSLSPVAILIKSELKPEGLLMALQEVLTGGRFYTRTVNKLLAQPQSRPVFLDHYDMLILYHLAEGKKTNQLSHYLPLSHRSIQRRKTKLKEVLQLAPESSDVELLNKAKEIGYL